MQAGSHQAALRILAVVVGDVAAAEAYARTHLGPPGHHQLLDMLLRPGAGEGEGAGEGPGEGRPPMLLQACHLMHAAGVPLPPTFLPPRPRARHPPPSPGPPIPQPFCATRMHLSVLKT